MGWNPFKAVKKAVKSVTKAVKKVAKAVVKVGKKVVSGVKSAVKSVGKSLSKLGPLASIALMAIPGFQAFAAGLAGGLGFTSTMAANIASGALTGFITSGGSLKGAVVGGAMAGAGSFLGDAAKASWNSGSLKTGFATAAEKAMANNAFTGGAIGMEGFSNAMDVASSQWGSVTDKIGDFFSSSSPTGDISQGAQAYSNTFDKYGMSPQEYQATYNKLPDTVTSVPGVTAQPSDQMQTLLKEQAAFSDMPGFDSNKSLYDSLSGGTPTELQPLTIPVQGMSEIDAQNWRATVESMGLDPSGQQAKLLAEQQYGGLGADSAVYDKDLAFGDLQSLQMTAESGGGSAQYVAANYLTPTETGLPKGAGSLLSQDTGVAIPPFVTQVGAGNLQLSGIKAAGGMGGTLGFTDVQRQTQARLIAQAEAQAEQARKRALAGWGVA